MDRKLFICDYEGTYHLLPGHPEENDVNAVRRLRREGHLFGIVFDKTAFLAMANMGEYEDEYDFIIGSDGAAGIAMLPLDGDRRAHTRIFTDTVNQYYMCELYDLFVSVGASSISADVLGFAGGDDEAYRFHREYDPEKGLGCWAQYWAGGGKYFINLVNRDALAFTTPFTEFCGVFKNGITAEGVAVEVNRRYYGRLRAYADGNTVNVVAATTNKADAVRRCAEFAGISPENVWTFGDSDEDACMLKEFNGIAKSDGCDAVLAATDRRAKTVEEAVGIILGE